MEINRDRKRYQDELSKLQEEYQDRKKNLVDSKEKEINSLKGYYDEKKEVLRDNQEAAVNHIQKSQDQLIQEYRQKREKTIANSQAEIKDTEEFYNSKLSGYQQKKAEQVGQRRGPSGGEAAVPKTVVRTAPRVKPVPCTRNLPYLRKLFAAGLQRPRTMLCCAPIATGV